MAINAELKKIREKKSDIYHGLRVLLAEGRRLGKELKSLPLDGIKMKDLVYVDALMDFILGNKHTKGYYEPINSFKTFGTLLEELIDNDFSDDVCQLTYKVDSTGDDFVYALIYNDILDPQGGRFDIFIVNTRGERR